MFSFKVIPRIHVISRNIFFQLQQIKNLFHVDLCPIVHVLPSA
jgi:hypothetical protein